MDLVVNILSMTVPFSVAILLASTGEMFNQRSGVFNLGCEGIMAMGAFIGMLIPFLVGGGGPVSGVYNWLGLLAATVIGALLGLFFGLIVVTFRAPQGIAGIGLQMFGVGTAGTLFRHFVGGTQSIPGMDSAPIPLLSRIPVIGPIFFSHNLMVYIAFLFVPAAWYVLFKTSWGLKVRAVGTHPRAADSMGINVNRTRYEALALGGALAGLAGAYLSVCQVKMFSDELIAGLAQTIQYNVQGLGIDLPYEFFVMLPYIVVIVVLAFTSKNQKTGPAALGKPFNREMRT